MSRRCGCRFEVALPILIDLYCRLPNFEMRVDFGRRDCDTLFCGAMFGWDTSSLSSFTRLLGRSLDFRLVANNVAVSRCLERVAVLIIGLIQYHASFRPGRPCRCICCSCISSVALSSVVEDGKFLPVSPMLARDLFPRTEDTMAATSPYSYNRLCNCDLIQKEVEMVWSRREGDA